MLAKTGLKAIQVVLITIAFFSQGLGVNTLALFNFSPSCRTVSLRLWERHKNPVSWVCRPFFGLVIDYGTILHSWQTIRVGVLGIGSSWFWLPKQKATQAWAEEYINKELEVLNQYNPWDLRRVVMPSIGLPLGLACVAVLLWHLSYP